MLVVDGEDLLADVLLVTPCLVCSVHALDRVVADEVLLQEDQLTFEFSSSRRTVHALFTSGVSILPLVGKLDQMAPIAALVIRFSPALASPVSGAPVVSLPFTSFTFPVRLVRTQDGIRGERGGRCVQFIASVGERFIAPEDKVEAAAAIP